jgi:signal transduction histidine kinase/DNA-binding response OmpR family regulator
MIQPKVPFSLRLGGGWPKPSAKHKFVLSPNAVIECAARFCIALCLFVICAWSLHLPPLAALIPDSPPMVLDTALSLILAACGVLLVNNHRLRLLPAIAVALLIIGLVNVASETPAISLHQLVFSFSGHLKMAKGTAVALLLLGVSLLVLARSSNEFRRLQVAAFLGMVVGTIALLTLLERPFDLRSAHSWETFFYDISAPTALCLGALGISLVSFLWEKLEKNPPQLYFAASVLSIVCLLLLFAGIDAAVWAVSNSIIHARAELRGTNKQLQTVDSFVEAIRRSDSGQRGYVLTGDSQYLKEFEAGQRMFENVSGSGALIDRALAEEVRSTFMLLRNIIQLEADGHHGEALLDAQSLQAFRLMEQVDLDTFRIKEALRERRQRKMDENGRSIFLIQKTLLVTYGLALSLALFGFRVIRSESRRRSDIESALGKKEAALAASNQELKDQTMKAEEASTTKSMFLASISHEIRTPMNAILGMSDLLAESQLDQEQRRYVEVFRGAGNTLLDLINSVLDLSKIEAGHLELESAVFDLEAVVVRTLELLSAKAQAKKIRLIHRIAPNMSTRLVGDANRLQQVLLNLVGNAVKFTNSGEVVVHVQNDPAIEGSFEFKVSDTGIGISQEQMGRVFNDFSQADSSTTRQYGGTGLGLGICRRLVEAMSGHLSVTSEVGQGSVFRFTAVFQPDVEQRLESRDDLKDLHGLRILVIDDHSTNRLILREMLSSWGLISVEVANAREGIDEIRRAERDQRPFAMVLLDREMPEIDGFAAIPLIRSTDPAVPIVMLTSDTRPGDSEKRRSSGLAGFAVKPVTRGVLLRLIGDALRPACPRERAMSATASSPAAVVPTLPINILVAEDSPDNRFLLESYPRNGPYIITVAEDGAQAVEKFATGDFDIVLMDMQMPVMDGLAATRAIRAFEQLHDLAPTPIVALTANAMSQHANESYSAGCNAHVAKPISKRKLVETLHAYRKNAVPVAVLMSDVIEAPEGLEEIVPSYLSSRKGQIAILLNFLADSNFEEIRKIAHDLKGTGTSFGFPELTRFGEQLQYSAMEANSLEVGRQLLQMRDYLGRVQIRTTLAAR